MKFFLQNLYILQIFFFIKQFNSSKILLIQNYLFTIFYIFIIHTQKISVSKSSFLWYNSLGKYQIQGRRKEQLYTKDKTALNVILSDCTRLRTFSQYVYGGSIFHS